MYRGEKSKTLQTISFFLTNFSMKIHGKLIVLKAEK
jgi:hypothetical protein